MYSRDDQPSYRHSGLYTRSRARRTRTGCLTCRTRKVKCDEAPGRCRNCERINLECKWPEVQPTTAKARSNNSSRQSRQVSCCACRIARCRCSRERPACFHCRDRGIVCDYEATGDDQQLAPTVAFDVMPSSTEQSPNEVFIASPDHREASVIDRNDYIPRAVLDEHINAFFHYVYPAQANAFVHRGTLLRDVQAGQVNRVLILALCAVASRFLPSSDSSTLPVPDPPVAQNWAREAKAMLLIGEEMTTSTVAAALLLARYDIHAGRFETAWILSSIACRTALALGLHRQDDSNDQGLTWVEQETRRRLFWACYCLDRMMSTGVPEFGLIRTERVRIQLPCEDHYFLFGVPCITPVPDLEGETELGASGEVGLFGHYVQLTGIRHMILECTRHPTDETPPWEENSVFARCLRKITAWRRTLLPQFQLVANTVYARLAQNQLTATVMLHVMYHQCMLDLHRLALPGFPESLPLATLAQAPPGWVQHHRSECVDHARRIGGIFDTLAGYISTDDLILLDTSLPIYLFEAMRVQIQWLFMLPSEARAEAVPQLQSECEKLMPFVERAAKYFRQGQWLLREMRKMLSRHGIPIRGLEPSQSETSGIQTPHHPWRRRIHNLKHDPREDEQPPAVQNIGLQSPPRQENEMDAGQLEISTHPFNANRLSLSPLINGSAFDREIALGQDHQGDITPDIGSFMTLFGGWMADGMEAGVGNHID
ncbi:hypothetical protein ASPZODRAFT_24917 [Penicilliopsis zonata CBS 506.65]|uniref:Zn(2)-C6 fungal-type domain-containing protein n=1 Tax=Penicilliopsis zonata CBS 506.65 TaxID=1073090 RepID=A0A1L9SLJ1_9EURO|nr:hypothetical protein ASPZODRAFT_24917 [Penicilliopsis zonata CBS 506.65]OJJ48050.1 hypothetical protein ASPZODRAFT_24917 [Penicilliopsis zonata CBS 506.65]